MSGALTGCFLQTGRKGVDDMQYVLGGMLAGVIVVVAAETFLYA